METLDIKTNTDKLLNFISEKFETDNLNNESLVQIIILASNYLNLQTIQQYKKANNMTYRGVKNHRQIIKLFNKNFVINND